MAGLVSYSFGGVGFLSLSLLSILLPRYTRLSSLLLSSLFLLYSLLSLSLPLLSLSSLFLLSSLSSLLLPLPPPLLSLLSLSSSLLELLFVFLPSSNSLESHYFSLLSVPSLLLLLSSLPLSSPFPRISRAVGLALHGTWLIQMGFSLFSNSSIAHGCFLKRYSWARYSVGCKGHMEYHRARALATLQFNCHLALVVVLGVVVYAVVVAARKEGGGEGYRPIGKEVQMMGGNGGSHVVLEDELDEEEGKSKWDKRMIFTPLDICLLVLVVCFVHIDLY